MTIGKTKERIIFFSLSLLFLILIFLIGIAIWTINMDKSKQPSFDIYGDNEIIKNSIINLDLMRYGIDPSTELDTKIITTQTLLYKGINYNNPLDDIDSLTIYISYHDFVGEIPVDVSLYRHFIGTDDRVNRIHLAKNSRGQVIARYSPLKSYEAKERWIETTLEKLDDFYKSKKIDSKEERQIVLMKLYGEFIK